MRVSRIAMSTVLAAGLVGVGAPAFASSGADRDCEDFQYQQDAQEALEAAPSDPERLDQGGVEGVACEGLPSRGGSDSSDDEDDDSESDSDSDDEQMVMPSGGADTGAGGAAAGDVSGLLATGGLLAAAGAGGLVLLRRRAAV